MVERFHEQNPLITVAPVYIGAYAELNTQLIAAIASGEVPALANTQSPYVAGYGEAGVAEILDPYIEAFDFDVADFGEGLVATTSHNGEQIALPYLISTQTMFYNKTAAEAEGITMPRTFDAMEEFWKRLPSSTRMALRPATGQSLAGSTTGTMRHCSSIMASTSS